jgi:hypothetical protein
MDIQSLFKNENYLKPLNSTSLDTALILVKLFFLKASQISNYLYII